MLVCVCMCVCVCVWIKGCDLRPQPTLKWKDSSQTQKRKSKRSVTARDPQKGAACFKTMPRACTCSQTRAHFSQGSRASLSELLKRAYSLLPALMGSVDQDHHRQMRTRRAPAQSNMKVMKRPLHPPKCCPRKQRKWNAQKHRQIKLATCLDGQDS